MSSSNGGNQVGAQLQALNTPVDNPGESSSIQSSGIGMRPSVIHIHAAKGSAMMKAGETLDTKTQNWFSWSQSMYMMFNLLELHEYMEGRITMPDMRIDPEGVRNWQYNDNYAQMLIATNIAPHEKQHTTGCDTAHRMWLNL